MKLCIVRSGNGYILDNKNHLMVSEREKALMMTVEDSEEVAKELRSKGLEGVVEVVE